MHKLSVGIFKSDIITVIKQRCWKSFPLIQNKVYNNICRPTLGFNCNFSAGIIIPHLLVFKWLHVVTLIRLQFHSWLVAVPIEYSSKNILLFPFNVDMICFLIPNTFISFMNCNIVLIWCSFDCVFEFFFVHIALLHWKRKKNWGHYVW